MANRRLNATITIGGAISGAFRNAITNARDGLSSIGRTVTDLKQRQRELNAVIAEQGRLGRNASALTVEYANRELAVVNNQIDALRRRAAAERESEQAMARYRDMAIGRAAGAVAIGGLAAAPLAMMVKASSEFNYQLQSIGNTANMSKAEIASLGSAIMQVSRDSAQSAENVQKGIGFLVAAGMDMKTAQATIGTVSKAATAAGADIENLAKASFVLNDSLGIAPDQMASALDILAQAGKEGNVELKDMAKQLPVLGSGFSALKMGGKEAAATMAASLEIARKGAADPDEAANNMKNFIAKVMSPETLKKAKKNFNLDLYEIIQDAQTHGKNPFEAAMTSIMKATKGDQKAIGELFSDMQVQNFLRPMIQNWDEYKRIKEKALKADGTLDADFQKMLGTAKIQMDGFGNAMDRLKISIGTSIEPALGRLVGAITPAISRLETFINNNRDMVGTVLVVGGAVGALAAGVLAVGAAFAGISWVYLTAVAGFAAIGTAFSALGALFVANPIGLAAIAIGAAAALIYTNWEPIRGFFTGLFNDIKTTATSAIEWIIQKIQAIGRLWGETKAFFGFGAAGAAQGMSPGNVSPVPPTLPQMAEKSAAGNSVNQPQTNNFVIHQLPGQDSKQLADEVAKRLKERQGVENRSIMFDKPRGY